MSPGRQAKEASAEKRIAQALCQGAQEGSIREDAKRLLQNYAWRDPICGAIYAAICSLPDDPSAIRELLPAKITRMGFPDVNWEEFFALPVISTKEAIRLMNELRL